MEWGEHCWEGDGSPNNGGYMTATVGSRTDGSRRTVLLHRASYEVFYGDVPKELEVSHTCDNRACYNPRHLVAETHPENLARADMSHPNKGWRRTLTHCPQGHPYNKENTYWWNNHRYCRTCRKRP